jgi:hypothetical protein
VGKNYFGTTGSRAEKDENSRENLQADNTTGTQRIPFIGSDLDKLN